MRNTQAARRTALALLAALVLCLSAPAARAEMVFQGMGLKSTVRIHAPGENVLVYAGQMRVNYDGIDYAGFCVDIHQNAGTMAVEEERAANSLHNGEQIAWLYETHAPQLADGVAAAALQVAIWEVLNEADGNAFDASAGDFYVTNNDTVRDLANDWMADLPSHYQPTGSLAVLYSSSKQDILVSGGSTAVPEPGTLALTVFGAGLALMRRRRKVAGGKSQAATKRS